MILNSPDIKILIVDDRQENLLALQAIFRGSGYQLLEAESGKGALELAQHHDFACIVMDVQMPIMDGFETALIIRKFPRAQNTPIIFVTAIHRDEAFEIRGYLSGAVDYLFKPINPEILRAKVSIFVELFLKNAEIEQQRKILEEALLRVNENKKLKEALKTRDVFLSMASHELKTPITPLTLQLQTFTKLVEDDSLKDIDKGRLLRMLNTSMGQVTRLSRLINELVDVSKLQEKKLDLDLQDCSLIQIVRKVIEEFDPEIRKTSSEVNFLYKEDIKGKWDPFRIEQIVINLLTNALKYGQGKPITIHVGQTGRNAFLKVADGGIGIKDIDLNRIFGRFERAVSGSNYSGLGMGLYIAREIVKLHGGNISVTSSEGAGSEFLVELPVSESDASNDL